MLGRNTDWSGYSRAFQRGAARGRARPGGARRGRRCRGRGRLRPAAPGGRARGDPRRRPGRARRPASSGWPAGSATERVSIAEDLEDALARRPGRRERDPRRHVRPPGLVRCRPGCCAATSGSATSSTSRWRPSSSRPRALAGCRVLARRRDGRPAGGRCLRVLHRPARGLRADGAPLRGADRLMRTGIATVSLSGVLQDKLAAAAGAGFDTDRALRQRPDRLADEPAGGGRALRRPRSRDRAVPAGA